MRFKVGDRVRAKFGSAAAYVAGYGLWIGTVKATENAATNGVLQIVVLMDDKITIQSASDDWERFDGYP